MDRRQYLRHFAILFSGTAAAQALNLLSYPFLTRLYTPSDFGAFALFIAVAAIPGVLACGRFDLAVPTAPNSGRFAILWLCYLISASVGVLSGIGAGIYWSVAGVGANAVLPFLMGLCVFLTGFCAASSMFLMRHDLYKLNSASLILRTGGTVAVQIALAFVWRDSLSLIIGFTAGFCAQAILLGWAIGTHMHPGRPNPARMRAMFRRFRRQVTVDIPSTLISAVSLNLLTFILLVLFGQRVVGYYALANRIAIMPLQLFNDALGQVFFQKAAQSQARIGHFWNEMKFNLLTSSILSIGVLAGVWLFARPFITLYLGSEWKLSADILIILAPMLAIRSLCMSVATAVFVLRKPQWLLFHNIANAAVLGLAFLVGWYFALGLVGFLYVAALLLALEYTVFALALVIVSRQTRLPLPPQSDRSK